MKSLLLSTEIIKLASSTLNVRFRYLSLALHQLKPLLDDKYTLATNGTHLFYDSEYVLLEYKRDSNSIMHSVLHSLLHCVFGHMFVGMVNREAWDLACDVVVENVASEMLQISDKRNEYISQVRNSVKHLTAEHLYRYYLDCGLSEDELLQTRKDFYKDDHSPWYIMEETSESLVKLQNNQKLNDMWKVTAERIQLDLETASKKHSDKASNLTQNLKMLNREKYDYEKFLKKFSVMGEVMKINDDEFDYIYYTYGLKLYKKMPLIEPLEYKDAKRIREFVIAIDTSGSVKGELVQAFLQKTYNILTQGESFFNKVNIRIIQCDSEIQSDIRITSIDEMEGYFKNIELHGLGGTDFRPVFEHVNGLVKMRELTNLKGLIYFTDGYGKFPANKPDYDAAFVFVNDDANIPAVPVWAIRLVLTAEELE